MTYDELVQYYQSKVPQDPSAPLGTPAGDQRFNTWTQQLEQELGITGGDYNDPASGWANISPAQLDEFEVQGGNSSATTSKGAEQAIYDRAVPGILDDINRDAGRRTVADNLATQATAGAQSAATTLARTQGGGFDGKTYFAQNQDVAKEYERLGGQAGTGLTIDQFAERHYLQNGQREGRQPAYIQNAQLAQDFDNANRTQAANIAANNQAYKTQTDALQTATSSLQQNLTGNLAAKAAALDQQVAALNQNADQLDATQRKALADQIAAMQANLEQEVATQKQALTEQLATLGNNASAEAQSRRAALQQEIAGLTAAQAPLNEARLKAAELQATAVNVGLERTRDQLTADAARDGYVGGSTIQDAALVRATVDARQRAAEAMGGARVANATDNRDIGARDATGQRTIADALAGRTREIGDYGANTNFQLTSNAATGRRQIGDLNASGTAAITNNTGQNRFNIGNFQANTTASNANFGADQNRSILDAQTQGNYALTSNNAQQNQAATLQGNAARANYQDQDYNRTVAGGLALAAIPQNLTQTYTTLDNYANSGLTRAQNTLNWWSTNQNAAPTPGVTQVQASNTGNDISGFGAGLTGAALSYGNANRWWTTPSAPSLPKSATPVDAGGATNRTSLLT